VLKTYADIAAAGYADSLATARTLQLAVNQLLANPTDQNMLAARAAWVAARISTCRPRPTLRQQDRRRLGGQGEFLAARRGPDRLCLRLLRHRFSRERALRRRRHRNTSLTIGGKKLNTSKITKELLADTLQEAGGVEANVATGYHAVEFLLWART
jgi:putative iron-regulated protein